MILRKSIKTSVKVCAKTSIPLHKNRHVIQPRTLRQLQYYELLKNEDPCVVVATGAAGSGKTLLATYVGIEKLKQGRIEKMIVTRPAVSVDESHGFLPGTLEKKFEPWARPIMDVIFKSFSFDEVNRMMAQKTIEFCPLAYCRGRTFENAWVICDESQNCTVNQMLMVLTRIGVGSKIIITGDPLQHDRGYENNGLVDFLERIQKHDPDHIQVVEFDESDVMRHSIIPTILTMYKE